MGLSSKDYIMTYENFKSKIKNKEVSIGIIGLGYVGIPLLIKFHQNNFKNIYGFDIDEEKIRKLKTGKFNEINHLKKDELKSLKKDVKFTNNFNFLKMCDCIIICVPTPLKENTNEPDIKYIISAFKSIMVNTVPFKNDHLIVLESTTYPGCTKQMYELYLNQDHYYIAFSPEREDPGNKKFNLKNTPKIVGGEGYKSTILTKELYSTICNEVIEVSNTKTAEMVKLLENIYRYVNISLIQELKEGCDVLDIDICEAINAAKTKPYGFQAFYPGPGIGGHCIPIDPHYYNYMLRRNTNNKTSSLIDQSYIINKKIIPNIVKKIRTHYKNLENKNCLILGASYKKDINDVRESPIFKLWNYLKSNKVNIDYYDPHVPKIKISDKEYKSIKLRKIFKQKYDFGIIITDHTSFKNLKFFDYCDVIFDTKNIYKKEYYKFEKLIKI
jgi:UDP-N-acetyl-D-glucosamine dehydrogenase